MMGGTKGLHGKHLAGFLVCLGTWQSACGDSGSERRDTDSKDSALVTGRVFDADTGKPLAKAQVSVASKSVEVGADGKFRVSYPSHDKETLSVGGERHAKLTKPAPKVIGHVELFAKEFDAQQKIDPGIGGAVKTKIGATLEVGGKELIQSDGKIPADATLSIATPDPRKASGLSSLPGDFDAKKGNQRGKLAVESPVFVGATSKGSSLKLQGRGKLVLPARSRQKSAAKSLYRFDAVAGTWLEEGAVTEAQDASGNSGYEVQVSELGWFAVGSFIAELSCVRACVRDANGKRVEGAHVRISGIDQYTQSNAFTDADGCALISVPADARLQVSAQVAEFVASPMIAESAGSGTPTDPDSCSDLPTLSLVLPVTSACPGGYTPCQDICTDLASDPDHCGSCDDSCEGAQSCAAGMCGAGVELDSGVPSQRDAGGDGDPDAGAALPEGGVVVEPDASMSDSGTGFPEAGTENPDGGSPPLDAGSDSGAVGFDGSTASCDPCSDQHYAGLGTVEACCIDNGICGSSLLNQKDFGIAPASCFERTLDPAQAGACSSAFTSGPAGSLEFAGCCLSNGRCGVSTSEVWVVPAQGDAGAEPVDLGLGCRTFDDLGIESSNEVCLTQ